MKIPMLAQDKANHIVGGVLAGVAVAVVCTLVGFPHCSRTGAIVGAAIAGAAKEGIDWYLNRRARAAGMLPPHTVDPYDFLATLCGGLLVAARP